MALANGKSSNGSCVDNVENGNGNGNGVGFTNLPYREPIDIQFKDITYTVDMGFNKGKHFQNRISGIVKKQFEKLNSPILGWK